MYYLFRYKGKLHRLGKITLEDGREVEYHEARIYMPNPSEIGSCVGQVERKMPTGDPIADFHFLSFIEDNEHTNHIAIQILLQALRDAGRGDIATAYYRG